MFFKSFYKTIDKDQILHELRKEGYSPLLIGKKSNYEYSSHVHPEQKLIVVISGSMKIIVEGEEFICEPGDKIVIAPYLEHFAVIGRQGCTFFWSEKL